MKLLQYLATPQASIKISSVFYDIKVKVVSCKNITINFSTSIDDFLEIEESNGMISIQSEYEKQKIKIRPFYEGYIEVLIPISVVSLSCNSVDTRITFDSQLSNPLALQYLSINVVNGLIKLNDIKSSCECSLNAVDGNIQLVDSTLQSLKINNVSSSILLDNTKFQTSSIHMVSGMCRIIQDPTSPRIQVKKSTMSGKYIHSANNQSETFSYLKFGGVRGDLIIENSKER